MIHGKIVEDNVPGRNLNINKSPMKIHTYQKLTCDVKMNAFMSRS
jgi:hypothetical protein